LFDFIPILAGYYDSNGRPDVFLDSNTFICYDRSSLNVRVGPDFYIAFGVDSRAIRQRALYLPWEAGKPPDLALEVASASTARHDITGKRDIYAQVGVPEYWRYDPTGGRLYGQPLAGERLVDGKYAPYGLEIGAEGAVRGYSALLDVVFCWDGREFDALDPETGRTIGKREAAEARAEAERQARLEAEAELARLRAQLCGRG
jgi:hypothetical protein